MTSPRIVTISSSYGAGGSVIAPQVAEALGAAYLDISMPPADLARAAQHGGEGPGSDEHADSVLHRLLVAAGRLSIPIGASPTQASGPLTEEEAFRMANETEILAVLAGPGGVIRGRGAAAFLDLRPDCLHVRLDGPAEARLRQAMALDGVDEAEARRRQRETDLARARYVRRFYDRDVGDHTLYHLVLDSTQTDLATCGAVIVDAAQRDRLAGTGSLE